MLRLALIEGRLGAPDYADAAARLAAVEFTPITVQALTAEQPSAVDAVIVLAQEGDGGAKRQAEAVRVAARAGKHLLVELPVRTSLDSIDAFLGECAADGISCMLAGTGRFAPANAAIRTALAGGKLGEPGLLRIHRWEPADVGSAGATLVGRMLRELDLAQWLFGRLPSEVYAVARPTLGSETTRTGNYLQLHLGFAGGGMALVDYAEMPAASSGYYSLSLIGSSGAAYADDHHNTQLLFREAAPQALLTETGVIPLVNELREFTAALREGRSPSVTLADAKAGLSIAQAAQRSLDEGAAVKVKG